MISSHSKPQFLHLVICDERNPVHPQLTSAAPASTSLFISGITSDFAGTTLTRSVEPHLKHFLTIFPSSLSHQFYSPFYWPSSMIQNRRTPVVLRFFFIYITVSVMRMPVLFYPDFAFRSHSGTICGFDSYRHSLTLACTSGLDKSLL